MTPDNPLYFITQIPPKVRLWIYSLASFAAFVFGIWQATNGNRVAFVMGICLALVHAMSVLYVPTPPKDGQK